MLRQPGTIGLQSKAPRLRQDLRSARASSHGVPGTPREACARAARRVSKGQGRPRSHPAVSSPYRRTQLRPRPPPPPHRAHSAMHSHKRRRDFPTASAHAPGGQQRSPTNALVPCALSSVRVPSAPRADLARSAILYLPGISPPNCVVVWQRRSGHEPHRQVKALVEPAEQRRAQRQPPPRHRRDPARRVAVRAREWTSGAGLAVVARSRHGTRAVLCVCVDI